MSTTILAIAVVAGLAVTLLAVGLSTILSNATDPVRRRVVSATGSQAAAPAAGFDFGRMLQPISKYVMPTELSEQGKTRRRLVQAGFRSDGAVRNFYGMKAFLPLVLPVGVYVGVRWMPALSTSAVGLAVATAAVIGLKLPDYVLGKLHDRRMKRLRVAFPDALDLLVVCVESGLGLAPAIERVARELEISHKDLAQELALVNAEIGAGVERPIALRNLADRCGLEDIRGLVGLLIQTIRFGTSIADALRVYSEEFRDKRMQKAEEQAAKIGTKMIFPLVFCLFPSFFLVAVGPAVMRLMEAFARMQ
jgi:tight adherence protein C